MDRLFFVLLGIWALLTGVFLVTNIRIEFMPVLMGLAALAVGVLCLVRAAK
jgi:uncharacterized membrane protein HdeD (DUF308 family)